MTKFTSGAAGGGGVAAGVATATGGGFALESVKKRPKKEEMGKKSEVKKDLKTTGQRRNLPKADGGRENNLKKENELKKNEIKNVQNENRVKAPRRKRTKQDPTPGMTPDQKRKRSDSKANNKTANNKTANNKTANNKSTNNLNHATTNPYTSVGNPNYEKCYSNPESFYPTPYTGSWSANLSCQNPNPAVLNTNPSWLETNLSAISKNPPLHNQGSFFMNLDPVIQGPVSAILDPSSVAMKSDSGLECSDELQPRTYQTLHSVFNTEDLPNVSYDELLENSIDLLDSLIQESSSSSSSTTSTEQSRIESCSDQSHTSSGDQSFHCKKEPQGDTKIQQREPKNQTFSQVGCSNSEEKVKYIAEDAAQKDTTFKGADPELTCKSFNKSEFKYYPTTDSEQKLDGNSVENEKILKAANNKKVPLEETKTDPNNLVVDGSGFYQCSLCSIGTGSEFLLNLHVMQTHRTDISSMQNMPLLPFTGSWSVEFENGEQQCSDESQLWIDETRSEEVDTSIDRMPISHSKPFQSSAAYDNVVVTPNIIPQNNGQKLSGGVKTEKVSASSEQTSHNVRNSNIMKARNDVPMQNLNERSPDFTQDQDKLKKNITPNDMKSSRNCNNPRKPASGASSVENQAHSMIYFKNAKIPKGSVIFRTAGASSKSQPAALKRNSTVQKPSTTRVKMCPSSSTAATSDSINPSSPIHEEADSKLSQANSSMPNILVRRPPQTDIREVVEDLPKETDATKEVVDLTTDGNVTEDAAAVMTCLERSTPTKKVSSESMSNVKKVKTNTKKRSRADEVDSSCSEKQENSIEQCLATEEHKMTHKRKKNCNSLLIQTIENSNAAETTKSEEIKKVTTPIKEDSCRELAKAKGKFFQFRSAIKNESLKEVVFHSIEA